MASEEMRGTLALQQEIEKAKFRLRDVNENIKKITGRDPDERRERHLRPGNDGAGRGGREGRIFNTARRGISGGLDGPPAKRRAMMGGAFSRLGPRPVRRQEDSGDEDEDQKHTVQSSVVATSIETRTKSLEKQSKDREGMARNRRMFGMILGTLQRFKTEAKDNKDKEDCRRKLEKKLDDKAEKEKKKIRQETRNLIDEKRLEMSKIRRLEQKMDLVQEHENIKLEMTKLANFLCTKAKPPIFYVPKKSLPADDIKLKESAIFVNKMIEEKKANMEKEIEEIMNRENEREERIRSRIAERNHHESGEEEEDEDDHHDDMEDHEDDQKAIDDHKAAFREDKENMIKKEPLSDNESSNTHGEGFTVSGIKQEETDGDDEEDDNDDEDMEMDGIEIIKEEGKGQKDLQKGGEGKGDGQKKGELKDVEENEVEGKEDGRKAGEEEEEIQDGGMVNTVGGGARGTSDKDKHSQSKSSSKDHGKKSDRHDDRDRDRQRTRSGHKDDKSSQRDDKSGHKDDKSSHRDEKSGRKEDRHRHREDRHGHKDDKSSHREEKSGHKEEKSRTSGDSKKSSSSRDEKHRRSRSKERRDKQKHSKHHSEDKSKRSRHDSSSDNEVVMTEDRTDSQSYKTLKKSGDGDNSASKIAIEHDLSSIQLPPSDIIQEIQAIEQEKRSGSGDYEMHEAKPITVESEAAAAERERKIVMAEDEEDTDDHPADE